LLRLLVAVGCVAVGILLMFIPGPAVLFFLIAGSLLSTESLFVARSLDWSELKLRAGWSWSKKQWGKLSLVAQIAVGTGAVGLAFVLGFASWNIIAR
jgi:hypothetical protein